MEMGKLGPEKLGSEVQKLGRHLKSLQAIEKHFKKESNKDLHFQLKKHQKQLRYYITVLKVKSMKKVKKQKVS